MTNPKRLILDLIQYIREEPTLNRAYMHRRLNRVIEDIDAQEVRRAILEERNSPAPPPKRKPRAKREA